jgi:hypothetical protein
MHATMTLCPQDSAERRAAGTPPRPRERPAAPEAAAGLRSELDRLQQHYQAALQALALANERAARAERRLRARLVALTWPATLAGLAGGFAAVVALRLAGL